jgi:cell division transport system permease protein
MGKKEDNIIRRRLKSSYLTTIVSITLVLFSLGLVGMLMLHAKKLSDYVKENISFTVIINKNVKAADIVEIQKKLDADPYVKSTEYITEDKAATLFQKEVGEDFVKTLGYNPLNNSIEVHLKAEFASPEIFSKIEKDLSKNENIKEVYYQKSLVNLVNDNIKKISIIILGFCILLLFIAIALINNTIRLSVYSKRFLIKTMQLIGATEAFIRMPFLRGSIIYGVISAFLSIIMLTGVLLFSRREIPDIVSLQNIDMFLILFGSVILVGLIISVFSTYFAVRKFLRSKTDTLYY